VLAPVDLLDHYLRATLQSSEASQIITFKYGQTSHVQRRPSSGTLGDQWRIVPKLPLRHPVPSYQYVVRNQDNEKSQAADEGLRVAGSRAQSPDLLAVQVPSASRLPRQLRDDWPTCAQPCVSDIHREGRPTRPRLTVGRTDYQTYYGQPPGRLSLSSSTGLWSRLISFSQTRHAVCERAAVSCACGMDGWIRSRSLSAIRIRGPTRRRRLRPRRS
jgi:hypothetical protein